MKKSIPVLAAVLLLAGSSVYAAQNNDIWSNIQQGFKETQKTFQEDIESIKGDRQKSRSSSYYLQDTIDEVKAERDAELKPIDEKIKQKEAQMRKVFVDPKLSFSQKKSKTTLLQKEINTLKEQRENVEEKYRQKIREFRYN